MRLKIHTNKEIIDITTAAEIKVKDLLEQLETGNLVLIETIHRTLFIINCININAIEILDSINLNIPPIAA